MYISLLIESYRLFTSSKGDNVQSYSKCSHTVRVMTLVWHRVKTLVWPGSWPWYYIGSWPWFDLESWGQCALIQSGSLPWYDLESLYDLEKWYHLGKWYHLEKCQGQVIFEEKVLVTKWKKTKVIWRIEIELRVNVIKVKVTTFT